MNQYAVPLSLLWILTFLLSGISIANGDVKEASSKSQIPISIDDSNTRIAYISQTKSIPKKYTIQVADSNGDNAKVIFASDKPITSLSWSPNARSLAYISYEEGQTDLFTHAISSGYRKKWSIARGLSGSLSWSPSGNRFVFSLSKDNNQDIYILDISENKLIKVTSNLAIDKDPVWALDNSTIFFTSDRSGAEQVYKVSPNSDESLISDEQQSHSHPAISAGGSSVYMVKKLTGGEKQILQLKKNKVKKIIAVGSNFSDSSLAVSPSENRLIYASKVDDKMVLNIQSINTDEQWQLSATNADLVEAAWSPYTLSSKEFSQHLGKTWAIGIAEKEYDNHLSKQAMKQGSSEAAYKLGKSYFGNDGIESIEGKGTENFRLAVKNGYSFDLSEYFTAIDRTEKSKFRVYGWETKLKPTTAHNWAIDDCPIKKTPSCKNMLVIIVHANHKQWLKNAYDAAYMLDKNNIPVVLIASSPKTWGDNDEPINHYANSVSIFVNGVSLTNIEGTFSSLLVQSAYIYSAQVTYNPIGKDQQYEITNWGLDRTADELLGELPLKWPKSKSISIYELPKHMESAEFMAEIRVH